MELVIKHYRELTVPELHDILQLRSAIFVVEQNCVYQDIDGTDPHGYHLYLKDEDGIVAYLRVLPAGVRYDEVSLGRVVCAKRRRGYATRLLREGIRVAREKFGAARIVIGAQKYARALYEGVGFVQFGDDYLEDGIPHIHMEIFFES
jgi:ElaA protein